MQNGFIKLIGRRPVYPVGKGWNEPSEIHRPARGKNELEHRKDEAPGKEASRMAGSNINRTCANTHE